MRWADDVTRGECHYCQSATVAVGGPEIHRPRFKAVTIRIGYLQEAVDGCVLPKPILVCRECFDHHLPANVAA